MKPHKSKECGQQVREVVLLLYFPNSPAQTWQSQILFLKSNYLVISFL